MLGLFDNTLTADDKYSRHNRENFKQEIQMHVSQKKEKFSKFFVACISSTLNFEYLRLVAAKMLGLFVNTLAADDKYSRQNRENFQQKTQTHLPQTPKTLFQLYIAFL